LLLLTALVLSPVLGTPAPTARADELLEAIPAEAWGFVGVRNLAEFDKKIISLSQAINAPMAGTSLLAMAKGFLGLVLGVNDNGGLAVVAMPAESFDTIGDAMALLVPTNDYKELLSLMQPEDAGDGFSKILFQGNEAYAMPKGNFAVFGPSREAVQAVVKSSKGVTSALSAHQLERWASDDLTVWVNGLTVTSSPAYAAVREQIGGGVKAVQEMVESFSSAQLSLQSSPAGLRLGLFIAPKADTPMAKMMAGLKAPSSSLLTGLPGGSFALVWAAVSNAEMANYRAQAFDDMLATAISSHHEIDADALSSLRDAIKPLMQQIRSGSFSISVLPEGPDGVLAVNAIVAVEGGAAQYLASFGQLVSVVTGDLIPDEEAAAMVKKVLEYRAGAEDGSTDHLVLKLDQLEQADEEWLAYVSKILGKDGLLIRLSAVDGDHVAMTLGGGAAQMKTLAQTIRSKQSPLAESAEIKKMADLLPAGRVWEAYLSANGLSALAAAITKAVDVEMPFQLPPIDAPVTAYGTVTQGGGSQTDCVIPVELLKAAMQAASAAMMGGGGPPPGGPM
ncbi:MAG: hypothetical protein IID40_08610, partial [Planctomycetes bacterium]|nr:hypothetical protein [Planctomycetota bacterium]